MTKSSKKRDPFAAREARKYERPIPSRELLLDHLDRRGEPLEFEQIADELGLAEPVDREALSRRLRAMERDGQIIRNRRRGYGLVSKMDLVRGRAVAHRDGYGFLVPDDGGGDLYIPPRQMRGLMHGDRAVARVAGVDHRGRREAAVVEVLERNTQQVVGRYVRERGIGLVVPDAKNIPQEVLVPPGDDGGAAEGQIVVAEIVEPPTRHSQPVGRIVEVLGDHMAPGMEIDLAIRSHGIPDKWPDPVLEEVAGLPSSVPPAAAAGRTDLRGVPLVTIDGEDARDFDDAVYCEPRAGGGWKLLVAIADVSAYVRPGTELDAEARRRGNSTYFPGRAVPMLPEALSTGICSLNPEVDRLCLVCEIRFDRDGRMTRSRFFPGVMRSHARLTYDAVAAALVERDPAERARLADLLPHLESLHALYRVLARARERRGAIDFDSVETRIVFGLERKIERIEPVPRTDAHRIIEECMVSANVAAARLLRRHRLPGLYRVHGGPTPEKLADLRAFLAAFGLRLGGGESPQGKHYAALLERAAGRPDARLIQTVLLRSLAQAVYSPDNIGHFGLALDCYAHFTSPIRRYPDLLVHRAIRHRLEGGGRGDYRYQTSDLLAAGDHASMTERRSDDATRDAIAWLKCEYMQDKVGETFSGLITAVTSFGLFVELDGVFVEGLVHVSALGNDYYHFDPVHHRLLGDRTRTVYRLADRLDVRVVRVDLDERKIDFELADAPAAGTVPRSPRSPRRRTRRRAR